MSTHSRISQAEKENRGLGHKCNNDVQNRIPANKLRMGNVKNKIMIPLSDGKTIVFIDQNKKKQKKSIKEKYENIIWKN